MDETTSRRVCFALRVEETKTRSHLNVSIHSNQHQMRLRKLTITLQDHFSLGIVKFDNLPKLLRTLGITILEMKKLRMYVRLTP